MRPPIGARIATLLLLLTSGAAVLRAQEADDAARRARARYEWYNEGARPRSLRAGPWSPEFRRFMMEAAARERLKWGPLIPGNGEVPPAPDPGERLEASLVNWLNIGPRKADYIFNGVTLLVTDSGRVRNFAPHPQDPNILYVAFSGGGVWKTVTGGASWAPITEALGSLSTGSLALDPAAPDTLYLGLGDPFDGTGIGLVKSTDGGASWSAPVFLGGSTSITQVFVTPSNSSVVLVGTNEGLYRSTNAGATFSLVPLATGQPGPPTVWSFAWAGGPALVLSLEASPLSGGATGGQIWLSTDNGASWWRSLDFPRTSVNRVTVASAPSLPTTLYALAANTSGNLADIFKSVDGGLHWRPLRATTRTYTNPVPGATGPVQLFNTQGWYDQMLVVDPANPQRFFFGGALHTGTSADGGRTFSVVSEWLGRFGLPYVHADAHAAAYDVAGSLYFGSDGGIFKSPNNGGTFNDSLNIGITTHLIYNLGSSTVDRAAVIGGFQDNGTRVRSGATSTYNQTIGGDGFGCDVNTSDPTLVLGSLYNSRVMKSVDGGLHFSAACSGIPECGTASAPFYTKIVPWSGSPTGNVVFTHSNTVAYRSNDYATSWAPLGTAGLPAGMVIRNIGVAQSNANVLGIVGSGGRTLLSIDGGASWTLATTVPNNSLSLSHIWFDRADPNIVYVASVAPVATATHLWRSANFGATWTAIDGGGFPTGVPVDVVKTDQTVPATLYAGTHLGVYRSDDSGATWTRFGGGMPLVEVTDLYISADSTLVRASTFGRGFWELVP
jgi:photosystem II stability/assembly factor-like uncharacterized protein